MSNRLTYCMAPRGLEARRCNECAACHLAAARQRIAELERERDEARKYLRETGDEMRARWNAINESLAVNRDLDARLTIAREALKEIRDRGNPGDTDTDIAIAALARLTPQPGGGK